MINPEISAIIYGLASAAAWGSGDFAGGFATKTSSVSGVLLVGYITGAMLLSIVAFWTGSPLPDLYALLTSMAAGISGVMALGALYLSLSRTRMGIIAPLVAVVSVMLPVVFGTLFEGMPSGAQIAGFGLALAAIWFLSAPEKAQTFNIQQLGLPVFAGIGFGLFYVLMDQAVEQNVWWPLVASKSTGILLLLILMFVLRRGAMPPKSNYPVVCLAGILDTGGNTFFALAAHTGRLDIAAVLSSMYPAATVLLAWIILKEHLSRRRWIGVFTAVAALALIAA